MAARLAWLIAPLQWAVQRQAPAQPPEPVKRVSANYLWAALLARVYEVFPLLCPICAGQMRIIAFITDSKEVCKILEHIGVDSTAPRIAPARGPPLWDVCDAPMAEEGDGEPEWDASTHAAPDDQVDQRINWWTGGEWLRTRLEVGLRLWRAFHAKSLNRARHILRKPGVTMRNDGLFMTGQGAILALIRLNFLSVAYLRQLPIDCLKIDRSFVEEIDSGRGDVFAETIVALAHKLGMETVAEGVATSGQLARLRELGCGIAQGFLYAKPMPHDALIKWMGTRQVGRAH